MKGNAGVSMLNTLLTGKRSDVRERCPKYLFQKYAISMPIYTSCPGIDPTVPKFDYYTGKNQ